MRLALAQALVPRASITLRDKSGRFVPTPDHTYEGRCILLLLAIALIVGACLAAGIP